MPIYKNYVIKQGDTIESIAQKFLGDVSRSTEIVSLNRLRFPYISDDVYDQLTPAKATGTLNVPISAGDLSVNLASYVANGIISQSALTSQSVFFVRTVGQYGSLVQDELPIKLYYPYDVTELNKDGVTYSVVSAGTLKFDARILSSPSTSAFAEGMLASTDSAAFVGSISGNTLYVSSMISGYISIGMQLFASNITSTITVTGNINGNGSTGTYTISSSISLASTQITATIPLGTFLASRNYYVRYTYQTISGETLPSPLRIEESNGAAIPVAFPSSTTGIFNLLAISAPLVWPYGATSVRVYIGNTPGKEVFQGTLKTPSDVLVEPVAGFTFTNSAPPSVNTAYVGFNYSYSVGTKFSIHENPQSVETQVLKTGSIILLPTIVPPRSQLIVNNALSNQFIDELGTDIRIDSSGFLTFDGSAGVDLTTVTGIENVKQSIRGRILTKINELKTQPQFGNFALDQIGAKYSANFLLIVKSALIQTLKKEPRITSIDGMNVTYNAATGSVLVNNLSLRLTSDGTSASDITFEPIALPI